MSLTSLLPSLIFSSRHCSCNPFFSFPLLSSPLWPHCSFNSLFSYPLLSSPLLVQPVSPVLVACWRVYWPFSWTPKTRLLVPFVISLCSRSFQCWTQMVWEEAFTAATHSVIIWTEPGQNLQGKSNQLYTRQRWVPHEHSHSIQLTHWAIALSYVTCRLTFNCLICLPISLACSWHGLSTDMY